MQTTAKGISRLFTTFCCLARALKRACSTMSMRSFIHVGRSLRPAATSFQTALMKGVNYHFVTLYLMHF